MWVGFLYTLVVKVPSFCGGTSVSRNGMEPSSLVSSVVKLMEAVVDPGLRWGQRCKMFSHGPMPWARWLKVLFDTYYHT